MGEGKGEFGQDWDLTGRNKLEKLPSFRILLTDCGRIVNLPAVQMSAHRHAQYLCMIHFFFYVRGPM